MFKIENQNIYLNRGQAITIELKSEEENGFVSGDTVKFSILAKGNYSKLIFQKVFTVEENSNTFSIPLSSQDTKIGDIIKNGTVTYWYEIELNNDSTLVGYDENGPKLFVLYPEAPDKED